MSNLLARDGLGDIASVGTFALGSSDPIFTPWGSFRQSGADGEGGESALGVEDVAAEAYARGWEEGRLAAEDQFAAERSAVTALAASLEALHPEPSKALALVLGETVERLVRQIVGEVAVPAELLRKRAAAAAALVSDEMTSARMRLNPDDLPIIEAAGLQIELIADAGLERGSIVVETALGWIEDGPSVRLDRLRAAIDGLGID